MVMVVVLLKLLQLLKLLKLLKLPKSAVYLWILQSNAEALLARYGL